MGHAIFTALIKSKGRTLVKSIKSFNTTTSLGTKLSLQDPTAQVAYMYFIPKSLKALMLAL